MQFLKCRQDFWEFCACESFMLNRLGFLILEVSSLGAAVAPVIWSFSQPSSHTWRCNSWTKCVTCLTSVTCVTVWLLLFLVYHFECDWSLARRRGAPDLLLGISPIRAWDVLGRRLLSTFEERQDKNKSKHYAVQLIVVYCDQFWFYHLSEIHSAAAVRHKWAVPRYRTVV